jgi:hypothetical protein
MYVRVKLLLLYGYLEIVGRGHTSPTGWIMEFNTVAWSALSAPLREFLQATKGASEIPIDQTLISPTAQRAFRELPIEFRNGAIIYGLLPGDSLEDLVFQPSTWIR